jgi:alkanesulfonate monooxygenase SsuD/methylene tetrahydromethanopterin reductase-like flavin-dependent oxidoreductase (luciferase family)
MVEGQEGVTWDEWVALARACEESGFEGLFRSDHYLSFSHPTARGALDAWATITALGAVTQRMPGLHGLIAVTFRHPAMLAKSVVTADRVSGGRVELGMGAGWFEREHGLRLPAPDR